ncbi:YihY/virulence factor BrkB family protein [Mycoplasmopsis felifaucium]|uniref:YihY/virulence factor BrkB family protein n=1 Tax=Mycoplasmopsis felifaucium TaxID=35768 RepID=UPI000486738C|nr:YhjD/YihY/BrkB family envelope integrity protein [Mycoplasmopsis felifaucium]
MKRSKDIIYSNLNIKTMEKKYNSVLKKSTFSKNILPITYKTPFLEKIIKFFIKTIMFAVIPRSSWKNNPKVNELINRIYQRFSSRDFAFIPVSFAFYLLVSFVPIMISVFLLLKLLPLGLEWLFFSAILSRIIPGVESLVAGAQFGGVATYAVIIPLFLASLWVSSGGFAKFIYSENYIYRHESTGNWFLNRLKGFITVFWISIYIFVSTTLYLYTYKLFGFATSHDKNAENIYFYISFSLYLLVGLYIGFSLLFKISPAFKLSWTQVAPGALIASVPTIIFISIFGYLTSLIDYKKFGVFGTFMYIALLVSIASYFMYLGIIANEGYYKTYHSRYTINKKTWFKKFIKH